VAVRPGVVFAIGALAAEPVPRPWAEAVAMAQGVPLLPPIAGTPHTFISGDIDTGTVNCVVHFPLTINWIFARSSKAGSSDSHSALCAYHVTLVNSVGVLYRVVLLPCIRWPVVMHQDGHLMSA